MNFVVSLADGRVPLCWSGTLNWKLVELCLYRFAHIGSLPDEEQDQHIAELPYDSYSMMQRTGHGYWELLRGMMRRAPNYGCTLSHLKSPFNPLCTRQIVLGRSVPSRQRP